MKIHLNISKSLLLLILATSGSTAVSCKKETAQGMTDDPNIRVTSLNITLQQTPDHLYYTSATVDINQDGTDDFNLEFYFGYHTIMHSLNTNQLLYFSHDSNAILSNVPPGLIIDDASYYPGNAHIWGDFARGSVTDPDLGINLGWAGSGAVITGVRIVINSAFHYGWIKYNINEDNTIFTIIEAAYDIRPNTPILAGAQ